MGSLSASGCWLNFLSVEFMVIRHRDILGAVVIVRNCPKNSYAIIPLLLNLERRNGGSICKLSMARR